MRQVMPHRSNIVADLDNCKNFYSKKAGHYHSFGLTFDRPLQLASAQITHLRKLRISSSALQKRSSNRHAGL
jgi:hypothetical protein